MAGPPEDRRFALARPVAKFVAAWAVFRWAARNPQVFNRLDDVLRDFLKRTLADADVAQFAFLAYQDLFTVCAISFFAALVPATALAVLGATVRMLSRARVRAGLPDILDPLRRWTSAHPGIVRAALAAPGLAWTLLLLVKGVHNFDPDPGNYERALAPLVLTAGALFALCRTGLRALLAPTGAEARTEVVIADDEIVFDAVAVTRETIATVAAFSAIVLGVPLAILIAATRSAHEGPSALHPVPRPDSAPAYIAAYLAFSVGGAYAFQRASRISVGVDGVHIRGTSRARFFAYRDVDAAHARGTDIVLEQKGKVVLRLQLHGDDAARREAIVARITANIARAREGRAATAARVVASASKDELARSAAGGGDYRATTLTREQLWALVESPESAAAVRGAAAAALAGSADDGELTRLRVAADLCAEPAVRIALLEIAGDEREEAASAGPAAMASGAARS